jgi:hypothetical protein
VICPGDGKENDTLYCFSFNHGQGCKKLEQCYKNYDLNKIRAQLGIEIHD